MHLICMSPALQIEGVTGVLRPKNDEIRPGKKYIGVTVTPHIVQLRLQKKRGPNGPPAEIRVNNALLPGNLLLHW